MTAWVVIATLGSGAVTLALWRRKPVSTAWLVACSAAATLIAAALIALVAHVASLPRSATPLSERAVSVHRILAVSDEHAFVFSNEGLLRLELPTGRVTASYSLPESPPVVTSVAWSGRTLLWTYHLGSGKGGWAALRPDEDGWLVAPHRSDSGDANLTAHWDPAREAFVLARFDEAKALDPPDAEGRRRQRAIIVTVDEAGERADAPDLEIVSELTHLQGLCKVGETTYAVELGARLCRLEAGVAAGEPHVCVPVEGMPERGAACAGQLDPHVHRHVLTANGVEALAIPTAASTERDEPLAARAYVRLTEDGLEPEIVWYAGGTALVRTRGEGSIVARFVDEDEARALGHVEYETSIERHGAQGELLAQRHVRRMSLPDLMVMSHGKLVLIGGGLEDRALLDPDTLVRHDDIGAARAVAERLSVWGGPSVFFDAMLVIALVGGGLWALFLLGHVLRLRRFGAATVLRTAMVYVTVALPTLLETISSAWHI